MALNPAQFKICKSQKVIIQSEPDIVNVRRLVREWAAQAGFSLTVQTKMMTAASELARNVYRYAKQGHAELTLLQNEKRLGLQVIFQDNGPGIADIDLAMQDGYSTGNTLGMGLGGTKRLVDHFEIESSVNKGTRIIIVTWKEIK